MAQRQYTRYVALGDSQTEGLNDGDEISGYRGWADRLSEHLSRVNPDLRYANLAVRGRLAAQVRDEQLAPALALRPDLATVMAGMNDLMRPKFDPAAVAAVLEDMFAQLTRAGADVVTVTFPDIARIAPLTRPLRARVLQLNEHILAAARRHSVIVLDTFVQPITVDPRLWSVDRLHASPLGHSRIAAAMAHALGLPGSDDSWTQPLPVLLPAPPWQATVAELRWFTAFALPWVRRRLDRRSTGDGRSAKRPQLSATLPVAAES